MSDKVQEIQARYPGSETFKFGDEAELSRSLLGLVRDGKKTATCMAMYDIESGKESMPQVGRRDIALNWDGSPALVVETVSLEIIRFRDVPEDFALAEGENATLAGWQSDHKEYFERNGGFDPDMKVLCERFRVIEDLDA
ncbi:MAG: ASCH domain-containing protein [Hyphomicrobiaceae bacterium]